MSEWPGWNPSRSGRLLAALDEMDLRALSRSLSDDLRKRKVTLGAHRRLVQHAESPNPPTSTSRWIVWELTTQH